MVGTSWENDGGGVTSPRVRTSYNIRLLRSKYTYYTFPDLPSPTTTDTGTPGRKRKGVQGSGGVGLVREPCVVRRTRSNKVPVSLTVLRYRHRSLFTHDSEPSAANRPSLHYVTSGLHLRRHGRSSRTEEPFGLRGRSVDFLFRGSPRRLEYVHRPSVPSQTHHL